MAITSTVVTTIRLKPSTRKALEEDAERLGVGFSEYLRAMAEAKELWLQYLEIREQGRQLMERLRKNPQAMAEFESLGSSDTGAWDDLEPWEGPLPGEPFDEEET